MRTASSSAVRWKAGYVAASVSPVRAGSGMLQWIGRGPAEELGADLAHAVAEADDVVEALVGELVDRAWSAGRRCRSRARAWRAPRSGAAASGGCRRCAPRRRRRERCSSSASAICERALLPVHRNSTRGARAGAGASAPAAAPDAVPGAARRRPPTSSVRAVREVERVVGVAPVGGAAPHRHQAVVAQPPEVVRDQALRPPDQRAQLAHLRGRCGPARAAAASAPDGRRAGRSRAARRRGPQRSRSPAGRYINPD